MPIAKREYKCFSKSQCSKDGERLEWLVQLIKDPQNIPWTEKMNLRPLETTELLAKVASGL